MFQDFIFIRIFKHSPQDILEIFLCEGLFFLVLLDLDIVMIASEAFDDPLNQNVWRSFFDLERPRGSPNAFLYFFHTKIIANAGYEHK